MNRIIKLSTGHTVLVSTASRIPAGLPGAESYDTFYTVTNEGTNRVFMYLGKGHPQAKREIVAWYPNTKSMWHSFGTTIESAIEGAAKDGWLYA